MLIRLWLMILIFMDRYGGYLDIGLYDTIGDMICTVVGSFMFIVIMKKRLNC